MTTLETVNASAAPEVQINGNFATLSWAGAFGHRAPASAALTWAYYGGIYNGNAIDNGAITLADNADNYIVVERATGVVSASSGTTNWDATGYARLYKVTTASGLPTAQADHRNDTNGLHLSLPNVTPPVTTQALTYLIGSQGVALTAGATKLTVRVPFAFDVWDFRASVKDAPTGADLIADVNANGTSIFATAANIRDGEKSTAAGSDWDLTSYPVSLPDDAELTFDIDQVGSTLAGNGPLVIQLIGNITP